MLVMPEDVLPKTWIEQTIRSWGVDVFIELLRRERPDVCLAAKQFDEWLGPEGIAGGDIKEKKRLRIELNAPDAVHRIEEVGDSDDDSDTEDDGGDDDGNGQIEIPLAPCTCLLDRLPLPFVVRTDILLSPRTSKLTQVASELYIATLKLHNSKISSAPRQLL